MATKRKISALAPAAESEPVDPSDELMFLCLGGGNEVGRSCHIIQYKGKTVMLDAGMHPAYDGLAALPYFDEFDLSTVDILLISHFHLDHAMGLPYVLSKTNFRGRVFMTHATKAIYKWLIQDSVRVSNSTSSSDLTTQLYTEADHLATFPLIEAIDYHTTHTISSIRITPYPAGHALGACMYMIEIAGLNILFTGDYSREDDRHLIPASIPPNISVDVLITESTFGIASHMPRTERETALMRSVTSILNRGGRVLMPVFALGRAQELLLILDEYWSRHPEYQRIPIYYASNLARKCMIVYQTYIGSMNDNIRSLFQKRLREAQAKGISSGNIGPWDFDFVRSLKNLDRFDDVGECVMLASPGMLQNGVSRELLERWAPSEKNGVVITGYSVEGTMGKQILNEPESIPSIMSNTAANNALTTRSRGNPDEKAMIPRRCSVQEFSFAAHVDGVENREFIEDISAPVVILVHGEKHQMTRLKSKLLSLNAGRAEGKKMKVYTPANTEELRIPFHKEKTARVVGRLADIPPPVSGTEKEERIIRGVLVQSDFKMQLMAAEDLKEYAGLTTTTIICRQRITLSAAGVELIKWALEGTFGAVDMLPLSKESANLNGATSNALNGDSKMKNGVKAEQEDADEEIERQTEVAYVVMGCVTVRHLASPRGAIEVEWEGNVLNDGIADAVLAVLFSVESSPAAVKHSSLHSSHSHSHSHFLPSRTKQPNPHADLTSQDRLSRLLMLLESHFGPDAITPITEPRPDIDLPSVTKDAKKEEEEEADKKKEALKVNGENSQSEQQDIDEAGKKMDNVDIPIPGLEIKVDSHKAIIWLDTLQVECKYKPLEGRVKAVVERGVEVVSGLWG